MRSGPEDFDSPDVRALTDAQQAEMLDLYEGEADIGPTREAAMFVEPDGVFLVVRDDDASPSPAAESRASTRRVAS